MLDTLNKVKDTIIGIITVIGVVLFGWLMYEKNAKAGAEALNKNEDDQKKLDALDTNIAKNDGLEQAEEQKRSDIEQELKRKENEKPTDDQLLDYFNKPSDK